MEQNDYKVITNDPMEYGNFKNYYNFHKADARVSLLPTDNNMWLEDIIDDDPYLVLDVGCNAGNLTELLWQFLKANLNGKEVFILGVDLDATLINQAVKNNNQQCISYAHYDIMSTTSEYETPISRFLQQYNCKKFHAVCCFSITMWIHLNHNDDGLKDFLRYMSDISILLIIEPQPWKCYQTAKRRLKKLGKEFSKFNNIKWRIHVEKHICDFLEELKRNKIYECQPTDWGRRVCFYR